MTYAYETEPFAHQKEVFEASRDRKSFAILWEQGTGKSKLAIDTAAYLYEKGEIDAILVLAPGGAHQNWIHNEFPAHLPKRVARFADSHAYLSPRATTGWHKKRCAQILHHDGLAIMAMPYSGFTTAAGKLWAKEFLKKRKVFYVIDEAHRIKEPSAKRTKLVVASGKLAEYKRVLTGTPIANGPFDVYTQLRFLDPEYWKRLGMASYASFKTQFGIWEKPYASAQYEVLLAYRNLDELQGLIEDMSSRVTKDEVLDLPPKLYSKRYVDLSPQQARLYKELKDECTATLESGYIVEAVLPIVRLLRYRQVLCGYLPTEEGSDEPVQSLPGPNPRLEALMDICQGLPPMVKGASPHKAIIWACFTKDIDNICEALMEDKEAGAPVRYDGKVNDEERLEAIKAFQDPDSPVQFFVANPQAASESLTLHAARTVVYYSSGFSLTERQQSEDRAHRIGQEHPVNYIDIVARGTVDEHIIKSLVNKRDIASFITQDELKEWL